MRKVLVATRTFGKYSQEPVDFLKRYGFEIIKLEKEEDLKVALKQVDALIVGTPRVTKDMMENSTVKIIAKHGVGVDNIDVKAATEFGIPVTVAHGANTSSVAELVIGFIFTLARNLILAHIEVFQRQLWPNIVGIEIQDKVLGLLGFGAIAKEVNKKAQCLGMKVIAHDPYVEKDEIKEAGADPVHFHEIFEIADFVSIHVPLNSETKDLVGESEFRFMKKTSFLINTSRGGIVNEGALVQALKNKWIAGAAIDVFSEEPPDSESSLFECENLITTPHIGAHTVEAIYRMNMMAAQAVVDFFEGRTPQHVVNKEVLQKMASRSGQ